MDERVSAVICRMSREFVESKRRLLNADLLVHFDASKKIILTCDASQYGIGAVMSHIMEDGTERPISFVSRTLAPDRKRSHRSNFCGKEIP